MSESEQGIIAKTKISLSISVVAIVTFVFAAAVWSADGRYVKQVNFKSAIQSSLIVHDLNRLRVELAVLHQREILDTLTNKEKVELEFLKSYKEHLNRELDYWRAYTGG